MVAYPMVRFRTVGHAFGYSRSFLHLTRLNLSRLISYCAYLKKSSFRCTLRIKAISKAVRLFVISLISFCTIDQLLLEMYLTAIQTLVKRPFS